MPNYTVTWKIDIEDAPSPRHAAHAALEIQREPGGIATYFTVTNTETNETVDVDLFEDEDFCPNCECLLPEGCSGLFDEQEGCLRRDK